jgi:D-threonate/D-erythronate kinase
MDNKNKIFIIADDFTGCGDIAYWAVKKNLKCKIYRDKKFLYKDSNIKNLDVLIVNAGTRYLTPKRSYQIFKEISLWARNNKFKIIFHKMDSTLRGNFTIESSAMISIFNPEFIPLVAAYPEYKRITKNGIHYVNNIKIEKTEFAKEKNSNIKNSHIPTIIKNQIKSYTKIKVYDAKNTSEIDNISKEVINIWSKNKSGYRIAMGTARFFGSLLNNIYKTRVQDINITYSFRNIFIINGSRNTVTQSQIKYFLNSKKYEIEKTKYYNAYKLDIGYLITSLVKYFKKYPLENICKKVYNITKHIKKPLMILCGGATSEKVCKSLKINELIVLKPIKPGIVLAKDIKGEKYVILKSGGFGEKKLLVELI